MLNPILGGLVMLAMTMTVQPAAADTLPDTAPVAVLVKVPTPAGAGLTRDRLLAEFDKAVPEYKKIPGLARKYFTIGADGEQFGGIYLWTSYAKARAFYNDAWYARILKTYGKPATVEYFDATVRIVGASPLEDR